MAHVDKEGDGGRRVHPGARVYPRLHSFFRFFSSLPLCFFIGAMIRWGGQLPVEKIRKRGSPQIGGWGVRSTGGSGLMASLYFWDRQG